MFQGRNIDRGKLVIPQPQPLTGVSREKSIGTPLHRQRGPTELPDRKAMKNRGLSRIVSPTQEGDPGVEEERIFFELLNRWNWIRVITAWTILCDPCKQLSGGDQPGTSKSSTGASSPGSRCV